MRARKGGLSPIVCSHMSAAAESALFIVAQTLPLTCETYSTAMRLNALNRRFRQWTWRPSDKLFTLRELRVVDDLEDLIDESGLPRLHGLLIARGPNSVTLRSTALITDESFVLFVAKYCPHIREIEVHLRRNEMVSLGLGRIRFWLEYNDTAAVQFLDCMRNIVDCQRCLVTT